MARRAPFPSSSIPAYIDQSMTLFVCLYPRCPSADSRVQRLVRRVARPTVRLVARPVVRRCTRATPAVGPARQRPPLHVTPNSTDWPITSLEVAALCCRLNTPSERVVRSSSHTCISIPFRANTRSEILL